METLKKEVLIGLIIGIFSNISGSYLYIYFFSKFNLEETINKAIETGVIGNIIALGAILNLFIFFIFIKKNQIYRARGVLFSTVISALIILFTKFY